MDWRADRGLCAWNDWWMDRLICMDGGMEKIAQTLEFWQMKIIKKVASRVFYLTLYVIELMNKKRMAVLICFLKKTLRRHHCLLNIAQMFFLANGSCPLSHDIPIKFSSEPPRPWLPAFGSTVKKVATGKAWPSLSHEVVVKAMSHLPPLAPASIC